MQTDFSEYKLQSITFDWLRFPLALCVVFIHNFGYGNSTISDYAHLMSYDIYNIIRISFSHVLCQIAVPAFYFISGFVFFLNVKTWSKDVYIQKCRGRIKSLAIPYLLWNLIAAIIFFIKEHFKGLTITEFFQQYDILKSFWNLNVWNVGKTNWIGMSAYRTGPINAPLWFLRDLIVVVIFTPVIYQLIKKWGKIVVIVLGFCYVSRIWFVTPGFGINAFFFFSFGAYFSIHKQSIISKFEKIKIPNYIITVVLFFISVYFDGPCSKIGWNIYPFFIITELITIFNIAFFCVKKWNFKPCKILTQSCFFVYACHKIEIMFWSKYYFGKLLPCNDVLCLIVKYFSTTFICAGVCVLIYFILNKFTPKLCGIFCGNR